MAMSSPVSRFGADRQGIIYAGRDNLNVAKEKFAKVTNPEKRQGSIRDAMEGADVFIGVSGPGIIEPDDLRRMADGPIVFALANPEPEIRPEQCEGIASVIATGRSDFPNQINNVLAFPGIFRGALDAGATTITENMKLAAADAIAAGVPADELSPTNIVPSVFDKHVVELVAQAKRYTVGNVQRPEIQNLRGSMGVVDSQRADVQYETFDGHALDRAMLDLLIAS